MTLQSDIDESGVHQQTGMIAIVEEGGVRVIRLSGEIDSQVVATYEESPTALTDRVHPADVIDASAVTFLDGRGLRFLVRRTGASRRAGGRPVLRRPARIVRRVVDIAGAADLFTITP
jgi:anti-anti-sigma factor